MSQFVPSDRQVPARRNVPGESLGPELRFHREYSAEYGLAGYAEDNVDLREVMAVLKRHALLILTVAVLVTGLAAFYVFRQPDSYSARAILRLKDVRGAITAGTGDAGLEALMLGRQTDPLLSELEILESPAVGMEVIDQLG